MQPIRQVEDSIGQNPEARLLAAIAANSDNAVRDISGPAPASRPVVEADVG